MNHCGEFLAEGPMNWWYLHGGKFIAPAAALIGVALGFGLNWWNDSRLRKMRHKAHFAAIDAEIEICREFAKRYRTDKVQAPSYRLSLDTYLNSLPRLLADGMLNGTETDALTRFFNRAQPIHRGLDRAADTERRRDQSALDQEYERNKNLKCRDLVESYYPRA